MPKIFSSFLSGFNVTKKKKGPSSEFCKFSPQFVRHTRAKRRNPQLSTIFGGKQKRRFLAGEKTPEFAKFQCENAGKNFALFALFCAYREHCPPIVLAHHRCVINQQLKSLESRIRYSALARANEVRGTSQKWVGGH